MPNSLPNISVYEKQNKHTVAMAISLFYAERAAAVNVKCHRHWKLSLGMFQTELQGVTGEQSHCVFPLLILLAFKLTSIHFLILFWIIFLQSHYRVCLHLVQECVLLGCCVSPLRPSPLYGCTFWKTVCSLLLRLLADSWEYSRKGIRGYLDRSQGQSFCVFSASW